MFTLDPTPFYYYILPLPFLILSFSPWTISISRMCSGVLWCIVEFFDCTSLSTCFLILIGFYSKFCKELPIVYAFSYHVLSSFYSICASIPTVLETALFGVSKLSLCCQIYCYFAVFILLKIDCFLNFGVFFLSFLFYFLNFVFPCFLIKTLYFLLGYS